MRPAQVAAWIFAIVLLLWWSLMIMGIAVFAVPDTYDPPESVVLSMITLAIGIAVPAVIVWALRAYGVIPSSDQVRAVVIPGVRSELERRRSGPALLDEPAHAYLDEPEATEEPDQLEEPLTEREIEVLQLVAAGKSNKEIAQELVISVGTVKTHTNNLYRKLSARNRTEAVAAAQRRRLI